MNRHIKISLLFSVIMGVASAQSSIEGTVTDNNGNALVGANVLIDGTSVGSAAVTDGTYRIDVSSGTMGGNRTKRTLGPGPYRGKMSRVHVVCFCMPK